METEEAGSLPQRLGIFVELPGLVQALGVEPETVLEPLGLTVEDFADPESRLPYEVLVTVLDRCAIATNKPGLGLFFGRLGSLSHLGLVGLFMQTATSLHQAMHDISRFHSTYARGGAIYIIEREDTVTIGYRPLIGGALSKQFAMASIAFGHMMFSELSQVRPLRLLFACARPEGDMPSFRGVPVEFNAREFALEYALGDVQQPRNPSIRVPRAALESILWSTKSQLEPEVVDIVKRKIMFLIFNQELTVDSVAEKLRTPRRTLNRHLARYGASVHSLIDEVRLELADQLLSMTVLPVAEIGDCLGFQETSSFTRFFKAHAGVSPIEWRNRRERLPTARVS